MKAFEPPVRNVAFQAEGKRTITVWVIDRTRTPTARGKLGTLYAMGVEDSAHEKWTWCPIRGHAKEYPNRDAAVANLFSILCDAGVHQSDLLDIGGAQ